MKTYKRFMNLKGVYIVCAIVLFLSNLTFGIVRLNQTTPTGNSVTILTAQASVPQDDKWNANGDKICYAAYTDITKQNNTKLDFEI